MKIIGMMASIWAIILLPSQAIAQAAQIINQEFVVMAILAVLGLTITVLTIVIFSLSSLKRSIRMDESEQGVEMEIEPSWWSVLMAKMTNVVPLEKEADILRDHNYDGIRELDNHLPPWWKYLFYITIIFAVVYLLDYHVLGLSPLQEEEYEIAMADAERAKIARQAALEESGELFVEADLEFIDDPSVIASGQTIYDRQCMVCHRDDGGGGIGPNLTDAYWIHGGSINDIYYTIKVGVPDKGMIRWEAVLSPEQMRDVSVYIITLGGSSPENAKTPQGELYEPEPMEEVPVEEGEGVSID